MRRMLSHILVAVAVIGVASGCAGPTPVPTLPPEPTTTPVFATEEEALAAATQAYAEYLAVSDEIAADGGSGVERIEGYVTPDQLEREIQGYLQYSENNLHTEGMLAFDSMTLQDWSGGPPGTATVYVCADASDTRVLNELGEDVTPVDRRDRVPLEVGFVANSPTSVLIDRSEQWTGSDFCS